MERPLDPADGASLPYVHGPEQVVYRVVMPFTATCAALMMLVLAIGVDANLLVVYIVLFALVVASAILLGVACYVRGSEAGVRRAQLLRACSEGTLTFDWHYEEEPWRQYVESAFGTDAEDERGVRRFLFYSVLAAPLWGAAVLLLLVLKAGRKGAEGKESLDMLMEWGWLRTYLFCTLMSAISFGGAFVVFVWDRRMRRRAVLQHGRRVVYLEGTGLLLLGKLHDTLDVSWVATEGQQRVVLRFGYPWDQQEATVPMPCRGFVPAALS